MRILKSIRNTKFLFLLLVVLLTAATTKGLCEFNYDPHKVIAIQNCTPSTNSYAENGPRIKHNFLGLALKYQCFYVHSLNSNYSYSCMESWSPRDVHFPTKSNRAPPETTFS